MHDIPKLLATPCCADGVSWGQHCCLSLCCAWPCCLPSLPQVSSPHKHLAPQSRSLPLLLKTLTHDGWLGRDLRKQVIRWGSEPASEEVPLTDGRWVGLRQPLTQGAGSVVHILLLAHEEGVLVEVKALAEVVYQALETYGGNSFYRDDWSGWLLICIIDVLQRDDKELKVMGSWKPGVKTRGLLGCIKWSSCLLQRQGRES